MGWCAEKWGALQIPYEINSRYPNNRLLLHNLDELGIDLLMSFFKYLQSDEYEKAFVMIEKKRNTQAQLRESFLLNPYFHNIFDVYYTYEGFK